LGPSSFLLKYTCLVVGLGAGSTGSYTISVGPGGSSAGSNFIWKLERLIFLSYVLP